MHGFVVEHSGAIGLALTACLLAVLIAREVLRIRTGAPGRRALSVAAVALASGFVLVVVSRFVVLA
jgi:hypothetical protein